MTDLREAAQMALDALEHGLPIIEDFGGKEQLQLQHKAIAVLYEALRAALAQPEQEIDPDRPHVEDDGCPTEKAVLQRFWREHQKQESVRLQCVTCGTIYADGVPPQVAQPKQKLWLWKNFVDGRPEYWAFDNPYPTNLDNGDPQTLGQPCGYAIFKPSRDGSCGRTEEQVLREMKSVIAPPQREYTAWNIKYNREPLPSDNPHEVVAVAKREWQGLTDEEIREFEIWLDDEEEKRGWNPPADIVKYIEAKLREKNI